MLNSWTAAARRASLTILTVTFLTGCATWTAVGSVTIDVICTRLGQALPTRSVNDTQQTQDEIQNLYGVYSIVCPDHGDLIPQ